MLTLVLWACKGPDIAPAHHADSVPAGTWWVGGVPLPYDEEPRHHAVGNDRVAVARVDGTVEIWDAEGRWVSAIPPDCETQCPVPRVGFVDDEWVILRPRVGALPVVVRGGYELVLPEPEDWNGQPFHWVIPKKWGVGRRPLAVDIDRAWKIGGTDDDVVVISPDRSQVAWSDWLGRIHVGEVGQPPVRTWGAPPGGGGRILEIAWSPESDRIVAVGAGQAVQYLDPQQPKRLTGKAVIGAPRGLVLVDSRYAIGWNNLGITCLNLASLEIVGTWSPGTIRQAHIGRDGRTAAIAGELSGIARIDIDRLCHRADRSR